MRRAFTAAAAAVLATAVFTGCAPAPTGTIIDKGYRASYDTRHDVETCMVRSPLSGACTLYQRSQRTETHPERWWVLLDTGEKNRQWGVTETTWDQYDIGDDYTGER